MAAFPCLLDLLTCQWLLQPLLCIGWELGDAAILLGLAMRKLQAPILLCHDEERVWRMPLICAVWQNVVLGNG